MSNQGSAGEKTEKPTPKRLRDARKKGQVAKSQDLTALGVLLAGAGALLVTAPALAELLVGFIRDSVANAPLVPRTAAGAVLKQALTTALLVTAPVLGAAALGAVIMGGAQVRALWTLKPLTPDLKRLDVLKGLGQLMSLRKLVDLAKTLVGVVALAVVVVVTLAETLPVLIRLSGAPPAAIAIVVHELSVTLVLRCGVVLLVAGVVDYGLQRWRHEKDLRMSKDEVRREHKEQEGDPQRKAERKRLHREIAEHDMTEQVRTADFVVANPTHLAVALRYDEKRHNAPRIVAQGHRLLAQRIKQIARQSGVPIIHNVPLARALAELTLGDEIPESLYEAVAEILRAVQAEETEGVR